MKKLIIILLFLFTLTSRAQVVSDLFLAPVKERSWTWLFSLTAEDTTCGLWRGGQISDSIVLWAVPTMLMNLSENPAIHGYPGDGYIKLGCNNYTYQIDSLQSFRLRDYCSGDVLLFKDKSYFALQDNRTVVAYERFFNQQTFQWDSVFRWFVEPSVKQAIDDVHPLVDSLRLASARYFDDNTGLDLQFTSPGKADYYGCGEPENQIDITNIPDGWMYFDLILQPTPSINQGVNLYRDTVTNLVLKMDNQMYWYGSGLILPDLPICQTCNTNPIEPTDIFVDVNSKTLFLGCYDDCADACDSLVTIHRQIVVEKPGFPDAQYNDISFTMVRGGSYTDNTALRFNRLDQHVRSNFPIYSGRDGRDITTYYRYRIVNTVSPKIRYR